MSDITPLVIDSNGDYSQALAADRIRIPGQTLYSAVGDVQQLTQDASPFRTGSWPLTASGGLYTLVGNFVMNYWSHNAPIDSGGNFLGRDATGSCTLFAFTEGGLALTYNANTATAGTVPSWSLVQRFDTSTGILTSYGLALPGTTSALTLNSSAGVIGQVLTSAGAGVTPTWNTIAGAGNPNVTNARLSSTANVTVSSSPSTFDGSTAVSGDVVFLHHQITLAENGLWTFSSTGAPLARASTLPNASIAPPGLIVTVTEGVTYDRSAWNLISAGTLTVGTSGLTFKPLANAYMEFTLAFTGKTSQTFSVAYPGLRIGDSLSINPSGYMPSGVDPDESEFEQITYVGRCAVNDTLIIVGRSASPVGGNRIAQVTLLGQS